MLYILQKLHIRILFFPPVPLWSRGSQSWQKLINMCPGFSWDRFKPQQHGRRVGEKWLTAHLFQEGLSWSGSGHMSQVVWASRQQPAHLRVLSTTRLLNRSRFPRVSLCWGGALWETHNKSTCCCFKCWGQETSRYRSSDCCFMCVSFGWAEDFRLQIPYSSGIWLSGPDTPCLSAILCAPRIFLHAFQYPLFLCGISPYSSIQAYYLHEWDSASMQKALRTSTLRGFIRTY